MASGMWSTATLDDGVKFMSREADLAELEAQEEALLKQLQDAGGSSAKLILCNRHVPSTITELICCYASRTWKPIWAARNLILTNKLCWLLFDEPPKKESSRISIIGWESAHVPEYMSMKICQSTKTSPVLLSQGHAAVDCGLGRGCRHFACLPGCKWPLTYSQTQSP